MVGGGGNIARGVKQDIAPMCLQDEPTCMIEPV